MESLIKIGIDGRIFEPPVTGVGKYLLQILEGINQILGGNVVFFVYCQKEIDLSNATFNYQVKRDYSILSKLKSSVWLKLVCGFRVKSDDLNFFVGGAGLLPSVWGNKTKTIVVVHDFNHILVPETLTITQKILFKLYYKADVMRANYVIANSMGTFHKTIEYFNRKPDFVILPSPDKAYRKLDRDTVKADLIKLNITYNYLLAVATLEPRKNLDKLISAFNALKTENHLKDIKLILVGKYGWKNADVIELINSDPDVIHLGYVSNETLSVLYNGAELFVFPSKYEGFGMPVTEALQCGTKVLTTDTRELREASNDKAQYLTKANDIDAIKEGILKCLQLPQIDCTSLDFQFTFDYNQLKEKIFNT